MSIFEPLDDQRRVVDRLDFRVEVRWLAFESVEALHGLQELWGVVLFRFEFGKRGFRRFDFLDLLP